MSGGCDHIRLHERLSKLTDPIFEEILLLAPVERMLIAPRSGRSARSR
jgi:hypothetical protein